MTDSGSIASTEPGSVSRRGFLKYAVSGVAVAAVASVAGSAYYKYGYLPSQQPSSFDLGFVTGPLMNNVEISAINAQKTFENNRLMPNVKSFTDPALMATGLVSGSFPFAWGMSLTSSANARSQGNQVQVVYPTTVSSNSILVKASSSYQSIADLKGKAVGATTIPAVSVIVAAEAWNRSNPSNLVDPVKDFHYVRGSYGILNNQLLSGQLDAIENIEPFVSNGVMGGLRVLTTANDAWKSISGGSIPGGTLDASESYAKANPDVTKRLIKTIQDSRSYILANPDFVKGFVKDAYNYTDTNLITTLAQRVQSALAPLSWTDSDILSLNQYMQLLKKYNQINDVPPALLTNAYNP